jgi:two-component system, OmpR family, sensor kinase
VALAPLGQVVEAARRRADGQHGERLHPDDPHTELGVVAAAYDAVLDELEAAIDAARDAEERTRGFLADAAHQLRTPIAGIRSSVESLLREADQAQCDELTINLVRETTRASRVLQSLLTLARYDTGHVPLRAPTDLAAICRDETERAESLAPDLEFRLHGADFPIYLQLDETAVKEALANLFDNARRHARTCVQVTLRECSGGASIRIDDDGAGLAEGTEEEIFERFVSRDDGGGSGVGLPIAREVACSHGGELFYDRGFVLQLPGTA